MPDHQYTRELRGQCDDFVVECVRWSTVMPQDLVHKHIHQAKPNQHKTKPNTTTQHNT